MLDCEKKERRVQAVLAKGTGIIIFFYLLYLVLSSEVVHFVFGDWFNITVQYYLWFVIAGAIPAYLAYLKKLPFFIFWVFGTFYPTLTTILVFSLRHDE